MLVLFFTYYSDISRLRRIVEENAATTNILTSEHTPVSFFVHGPSTVEERSDDDLGSLLQRLVHLMAKL